MNNKFPQTYKSQGPRVIGPSPSHAITDELMSELLASHLSETHCIYNEVLSINGAFPGALDALCGMWFGPSPNHTGKPKGLPLMPEGNPGTMWEKLAGLYKFFFLRVVNGELYAMGNGAFKWNTEKCKWAHATKDDIEVANGH